MRKIDVIKFMLSMAALMAAAPWVIGGFGRYFYWVLDLFLGGGSR